MGTGCLEVEERMLCVAPGFWSLPRSSFIGPLPGRPAPPLTPVLGLTSPQWTAGCTDLSPHSCVPLPVPLALDSWLRGANSSQSEDTVEGGWGHLCLASSLHSHSS